MESPGWSSEHLLVVLTALAVLVVGLVAPVSASPPMLREAEPVVTGAAGVGDGDELLAGAAVAVAPTTVPPAPSQTMPPIPTTTLPDPTEIPVGSGEGRRIVYCNSCQRVWLVGEDGELDHTWLVSGRKWVPDLGEYEVFGKSEHTQNMFYPEIEMNWMVRFTISPNGKNNIGFHEIPTKNGVPMQTEDQLGTHQSGGCIRLAPEAAKTLYDWADIGTKVVVIA